MKKELKKEKNRKKLKNIKNKQEILKITTISYTTFKRIFKQASYLLVDILV